MINFLRGAAYFNGAPGVTMHGTLHFGAHRQRQFHQGACLVGQRTGLTRRSAKGVVRLKDLGIPLLKLKLTGWQCVWTGSV